MSALTVLILALSFVLSVIVLLIGAADFFDPAVNPKAQGFYVRQRPQRRPSAEIRKRQPRG